MVPPNSSHHLYPCHCHPRHRHPCAALQQEETGEGQEGETERGEEKGGRRQMPSSCNATIWHGSDGECILVPTLTSSSFAPHRYRRPRARSARDSGHKQQGTHSQGQATAHEAGQSCCHRHTCEPEGSRHLKTTWTCSCTQILLAAWHYGGRSSRSSTWVG